MNLSDDSIIRAESEIAKELVVAQREYNRIAGFRPVPRLRKPSVYIPCKQAKLQERLEEVAEEVPPPSECSIKIETEIEVTVEVNEPVDERGQKVCKCNVKFKERRLQEEPPKIQEIMPIRDRGDSGFEAEEKEYRPLEPMDLPDLPEIDAGKNVTITRKPSPRCKCRYLVQKKLKEQSCDCEKCREMNKQPPTYIVAGLKQTEDDGTVPIIEGVKVETCECMTEYQRRIEKYEEYKTRHDMVEQMRSLSQKYIIGGVYMGPQGKPIFTISGQ